MSEMKPDQFQLLRALPPEIAHNIITTFASGKDLSTLSLALASGSRLQYEKLFKAVIQIGQERLLSVATFIESKSGDSNNGEVDGSVAKAVAWIRSVVTASSRPNETTTEWRDQLRLVIRHHSENTALLDFLQDSLVHYCCPDKGEFEWPTWVGQICVEAFVQGNRVRNTARVILTAPMQRPSYIPGSALLRNQTPSTVFRCELYNMIPTPPWCVVRPFSDKDERVLRPVAERLDTQGHVAVPSGFYHTSDILDVRIISSRQAGRLLANRSWRPRTDWIVRSRSESLRLLCCWQDDSADLLNDREYLTYIIDMFKTRKRLASSSDVSSREYVPT